MATGQPDFFVVGAPKCGTTALCKYLSEHKNVFFSSPKEPHYFAEDFDGHRPVKNASQYQQLFDGVLPHHKRIGEGSVWYLYSRTALKNISVSFPDARIIIMLRNPVDVVRSLHGQHLLSLYEDESDVLKAWELRYLRRQGRCIPRLCRQPQLLDYEEIVKFGCQIKRVFKYFPRDRIKVVLFEEFVQDTRSAYLEVIRFLALPDDGRNDFPVVNEARRLNALGRLASQWAPEKLRNKITSWRFNRGMGWVPALADILMKIQAERKDYPIELAHKVHGAVRDDVLELESLLGRDLGVWGIN